MFTKAIITAALLRRGHALRLKQAVKKALIGTRHIAVVCDSVRLDNGGTSTEAAEHQHARHIDETARAVRKRIVDEAWELLTTRFVDSERIDWTRMRRRLDKKALRDDAEMEQALHWLFARADDTFTRYLPRDALEAMKGDIDGSMCGVGIVFSADRYGLAGSRRVIIKHVVKGSPADEAGLLKGDRITAIDMVGVGRMSFDEATSRLLGKEGKTVLLSFKRGRGAVELSMLLTRRRFEVPTVSAERVFVKGIGDVGYMQVREFAANTAAQTRRAVRHLAKRGRLAAVVLDMRGNNGGLVDKAVEVGRVFVRSGQIVVSCDRREVPDACGEEYCDGEGAEARFIPRAVER